MSEYDKNMVMMTRVAWMHYIQGMTHEEIALRVGFSRSKVTRMLAKAREAGIVEINLKGAYRACVELEESLKEKTGLSKVIVAPSGNDCESTQVSVGKAAADYLNGCLCKNDVLGLAWGMSFKKILPYIKDRSALGITTVQLMGGVATSEFVDPQRIVSQITNRLGARGVLKSVPVVVDSWKIKKALLSDSGVREMMEKVSECTRALMGIGSTIPEESSICRANVVSRGEMLKIHESGAVGDVIGWFIDAEGKVIDTPMNERMMSPAPEVVKQIPEKIIETSGLIKLEPTIAAIRGGWVDVLIIDEELADAIDKRL